MPEIILNESQAKLLAAVHGPVRVRDDAGNVLGYISPGEFADDQQYVHGLRAAAAAHSKAIERLVLDGLNSGEPVELTEDWWQQKRAALTGLIGKEDDA